MSWIYEFKDDDGIGTYTGKHGGRESLGTRINRHFGLDAEHSRHADSVQAYAVHPDDLDYEEQQAIKNANDGQGTVFNRIYNNEGRAEAYYEGYRFQEVTSGLRPMGGSRVGVQQRVGAGPRTVRRSSCRVQPA